MEESISVVCITPLSQSPWCPLHRFRSISAVCSHCQSPHHTTEPNFTAQSQNKNLAGLWLLLKGQSGEILLGMKPSIMKEKNWSIKSRFTKPTIWAPPCHAQLCDRISWQNRKRMRKYFALFISGPYGFESWKNWGQKLVTHSLLVLGQVNLTAKKIGSLLPTVTGILIFYLTVQLESTEIPIPQLYK